MKHVDDETLAMYAFAEGDWEVRPRIAGMTRESEAAMREHWSSGLEDTRATLRRSFETLGYEVIPFKKTQEQVLQHVPKDVRLTERSCNPLRTKLMTSLRRLSGAMKRGFSLRVASTQMLPACASAWKKLSRNTWV